jgi:Xaa-Pro aminopeptidase
VIPNRQNRIRAELRSAGLDAIVITHPPNIRYLTGLNASTAVCVLTQSRGSLIVDFSYATAAADAANRSGLDIEVASGSLDDATVELIRRLDLERVGIEGAHLVVARFARLAESGASVVSTDRVVEGLRAVKDDEEIAILREAARRISRVALRAREWAVPGADELEVAAAVDAAMRDAGFERPAFDTIVGSGPNGALPHGRPTRRKLAGGEGVVLDFGGVYDGYCVDLTRTVLIGRVPEGFRRMFDAVREAHAAAIAAVASGVPATDIDGAARRVLERHGLGAAFGHGTGHGLGLEVHEEPRISRTAPAEPVLAGMVFTIEPGVYVPGVGGVRIEDDVLVTKDGCEVLTDVPIEL